VTRRVDAAWLREAPLRGILAALDGDGEEARIVGGAVRNALLGEPHGDIDIATTAPPSEVIRRVEAAGFKAVPTGVEHGTVTVVAAPAISAKRSLRPSAHRTSISTSRPSIQPSSRSRCTKAANSRPSADGVIAPKNPMIGSFVGCCARAPSGHAAAAPPSSVINSRRFTRSPRRRRRAAYRAR
jgi:Poly A polymerase head domain